MSGMLDVVLAGMIAWMQGTKALCDVELLDDAKTPLLVEWTERFARLDGAKALMPDVGKLVEFAKIKRASCTLIKLCICIVYGYWLISLNLSCSLMYSCRTRH